MIKIMFVCHGNICRSPMAEFIMKNIVKSNGREDEFLICSCATSTEEIYNGVGNPIYPPVKAMLRQNGISFYDRTAVLMQKSDYEKYDLFVCMDERNISGAMRIFGSDPENKICKLLQFTNTKRDVSDPWYSRDFLSCYNDVLKGCTALFEKIVNKKVCYE